MENSVINLSLARCRKPALALCAMAMLASLSACGSANPELDDKLRRAEAAAQRASEAQKAAEAALARMELLQNSDDRRGNNRDDDAPVADNSGDNAPAEENAGPVPEA